MEYWDSYYAKYPYYGPPSYPPSYPGPVPPSEISVCGATHMRCALSDSDSDSSSTPTQKQDVYTSATKYAAISSSQSTPESRLKKTNGTESSLAENGDESVIDVDAEPATANISRVSLQIINPKKKKEYQIIKVKPPTAYTFEKIQEVIKAYTSNTEFGYIEPGHGLKGKREWIHSEEDITIMVGKHGKKSELRLWCYSDAGEPSNCSSECGPEPKKPRTSKYDGFAKKLAKVDELFQELDKKHHGKLSVEQLNAWAHLVQAGKYASLDLPPDMPFFKTGKKKACNSTHSSVSGTTTPPPHPTTTHAVSPSRRVGLRTECIEQLQKWHSLLQNGAITKAQYDDLQDKILNDIKKF